ncbi:hypothetical protein DYB28_002680 [Aphanomyces astaci]|uniref:Kri1-like C-terminal domain-containing protein n=2 Tax=Aphanomyces astaci TaxID=112090 RepID=A0A9X8H8Q0_APHAT|nr:hypothetical protein DYB28_002680 [Aphanomyces astaci]
MAKKVSKTAIFDGTGKGDEDMQIRINESFAKKYDEQKRYEELQNLKHADLSDDYDESDSETDDEDGDQLTEEVDKDIARTLKLIRKKDPSIYDTSITFFQPGESDDDNDSDGNSSDDDAKLTKSKQKKADKPLYYKDLVRQQVLAGDVDGSDVSDDDEAPATTTTTYAEDQARLKGEFLQSLAASGADGDDELDGGLFMKRTKTSAETEADLKEYEAFKELHGDEITNPDEFLNKYLKSGVWKEGHKTRNQHNHRIQAEDAVDDSEDEEALDKADAFEHAYNFRFEEDGGGQIQTFSRHIDDSLRRKDDKRKVAREERKARKALERLKKEEELRRLKNLKQADIEAKLDKVRALMGDDTGKLTAEDIDGAFDPAEHDRRMAEVFDDDYYGGDDGDKPTWNDDDDVFGKLPEEYEVEEDEVNSEHDDDIEDEANLDEMEEGDGDEHGEEDGDEEENSFNQSELDAKKKKYLDELYALDYEDLIGDLPCRFKYREVAKNNYGLTTQDILHANDQELKAVVSLKRLAPFADREHSVNRRKVQQLRKVLKERSTNKKTRGGATAEEGVDTPAAVTEVEQGASSNKKKRKRKGKKTTDDGDDTKEGTPEVAVKDDAEDAANDEKDTTADDATAPAKKKRKHKKKAKKTSAAAATPAATLSASRLESYRLKPLKK